MYMPSRDKPICSGCLDTTYATYIEGLGIFDLLGDETIILMYVNNLIFSKEIANHLREEQQLLVRAYNLLESSLNKFLIIEFIQ